MTQLEVIAELLDRLERAEKTGLAFESVAFEGLRVAISYAREALHDAEQGDAA